ncbi:MAG: methyltransferase domain-containing protein [Chloroflexi bacterium]|nr:methyltransferase domain-containing protein [Chloroflexota bacterium]
MSGFGLAALALLNPQPGERILDLGCGEGALTAKLVEAGCTVVGVDGAAAMVEAARHRGLDVRLMDGQRLQFSAEFDAVFSNAALHWMPDPDAVIAGVRRALKPSGRFVAEFGGHGNVATIVEALRAVLARRGVEGGGSMPWYFPKPETYAAKLRAGGFAVENIALFPRPTPLPTDMAGWLDTFGESFFSQLPPRDRDDALAEVIERLRPSLYDHAGHWTADYVRLRFAAHLPRA